MLKSTARGLLGPAESEKKRFILSNCSYSSLSKKRVLDQCWQYTTALKAIEKLEGNKNGTKVSKKQHTGI